MLLSVLGLGGAVIACRALRVCCGGLAFAIVACWAVFAYILAELVLVRSRLARLSQ